MNLKGNANVVIAKVNEDLFILRYNDSTTRYFETLEKYPGERPCSASD
ncbi:MAG: hypothetical protein L7G99_01610 [Vulcanisaeta sp.]|jgi:hypothetical protein|nr:hypothetical protein [Vulcanisaeta sp.]